jgi:hypothetical protein
MVAAPLSSTGIGRRPPLRRDEPGCFVLYVADPQVTFLNRGALDDMARGRLKDKKTRKKHRKNIKRMKALAKARREQAHAAKSKRK